MNSEFKINLEPLYLYILSLLPVKRLDEYDRWLARAGSFEKIYYANEKTLAEFGLGLELIIKLRKIKAEQSIEKLVKSIEQTGVNVLPYYDERYPTMLKEIHDPPPVLFYRGKLGVTNEACVAIVGSRKMSSYGLAVVPQITEPLINTGITIVSGLAYGIDSAAHAQSIKHKARTIAVLGTGVDPASIYPRGHFRLSEQILEFGGLLLSEQSPGTPGFRQNFIARNRIIAGLSLGAVIVEAKKKSGALITADYAMEFNRAVYAVPGPAYSSLSDGPHALIKSGAALVTNGEEILEDLEISLPVLTETLRKTKQSSFSETEQLVLKCMHGQALSVTQLALITKLDANIILQTLTMLELRGVIKNVGEGFIKI
jgi:DNA processing protein